MRQLQRSLWRAEIASVREAADASNAAAWANFEATVAAADCAVAATIEQQQTTIGAAVRRLVAEKLSTQQVVRLTELTRAEVRNLGRHPRRTCASYAENDAGVAEAAGRVESLP